MWLGYIFSYELYSYSETCIKIIPPVYPVATTSIINNYKDHFDFDMYRHLHVSRDHAGTFLWPTHGHLNKIAKSKDD